MLKRILALCCAVSLMYPPFIHADEESDDQTFVSLTRRSDKMSKLPANISVVTADDIKAANAKSLDEVITRVVGVQVSKSGSEGTFSTMRIRGVPSSAQVAIIIDDQPYGGFSADQNVDISQIPVENIDRIEVVRGGSSVLYGANTTGGVVHIFTKKKTKGKAEVAAGYEGRSFQTKISRAEAGGDLGRLSGFANVSHMETNGFQENSNANNTSGFGSLNMIVGSNIRLGLEGSGFSHEVGVPQGTNVPIEDWDGTKERAAANPTKRSKREREEGRVHVDVPMETVGEIKSTLYGSRDVYAVNKSAGGFFDPDYDQTAHVLGGDVRFIGAAGLTAGVSYERDENKNTALPEWKHVTNEAGYAEYNFDWEKLTLIPAVRYDHNSNFGGVTNPRLSAVFQATKKWILSANVARSFRAPSFFDLFFDSPPTYASNRDLKPEKAWTYDVGNEFKFNPQSNVKVVGFYTNITDRIAGVDRDGDGIKETNDNVSDSVLAGAEVEARTRVGFVVPWGNYTYQRSKSPATNKSHFVDNPLNPHHLANIGLDFELPAQITFTNLVRYVGKQYSSEDRKGTLLPSYAVWNARVAMKFKIGEIFAGVNNILDRRYAESFDFDPITFATTLSPMPVRNCYAGVMVRFAAAQEN